MKRILLFNVIAVILFLIPKINFGQSPNLGTAADFVLFTSVGEIAHTGTVISQITGNVGTNSGASIGFGNVNGQMHDQDLVSAQCSADLLLLYNDLASAVPTFFPAPLLGNGQVLVPGVYAIPDPTTLNLDLTLDALGDPGAIFIIQIGAAFSTAANSEVILVNGAQACNVFWKIEGLVDMATNTTMKGTVVVNNAAINMPVGCKLEGRLLSTAGAITVGGMLAYTPIGCGSPVLNGPLAPALGSIICYTIFSSDGPVTNDGVTNVIGDVGSNNGLTTGYDPLFVQGLIHAVPDGSTAQAAADLLTAYNFLEAIPYDIELLFPALFGNSLVLTPHTYLMNGAVTFTDTLYLNALDNPDAVFVIKIYGALSTSVYSKVSLINGTKAENVYWLVNGAVEIGDYSEFVGTIVCNNGAMDILSGVNINGRVLTTVGALNTHAITAIMPLGCGTVSEPIIITEPINQASCDGSAVTFSVSATGTNLTYQWRIGDVDLVDGGNISGALTNTLTIDPATILDVATNYNVIVSGTYLPSDTSNFVSLTLGTAPNITTQPSNQITCVGQPVSFSVIAEGTNLSYQWRRGLVDLIDGANISGVNTATLTIDPTALGDVALDYNVVVSGDCLPDEVSSNASLELGDAPNITTQPINQIVCEGELVSFSVVAEGDNLTYQWRIGLVDLVDGTIVSGVNTSELTIDPVNISDASVEYNVVVSGSCDPSVTSDNVSLEVNPSPVAVATANSPLCIGDMLTLTAETVVGGTYLWTHANGYSSTDQNSEIFNVTADDAGTYFLTVTADGCISLPVSVDVQIDICEGAFFIPEGFSPNADGINDLFIITGIEDFPNNDFTVYNRWGNIVFQANPYTNTWDGKSTTGITIGGDELPVGTYFYVIDLGDGSDVIKGTIFLNR
jgi:gliding motility-associated-like protein